MKLIQMSQRMVEEFALAITQDPFWRNL
jgi:hypothetical protein